MLQFFLFNFHICFVSVCSPAHPKWDESTRVRHNCEVLLWWTRKSSTANGRYVDGKSYKPSHTQRYAVSSAFLFGPLNWQFGIFIVAFVSEIMQILLWWSSGGMCVSNRVFQLAWRFHPNRWYLWTVFSLPPPLSLFLSRRRFFND